MQILNIIVTKQKYFLWAFIFIFILLNQFTENSFTYLYEQLDSISINKNIIFSENFYTNSADSLYISIEDIDLLKSENPSAIITDVVIEPGPQESSIFYIDPKLQPEFASYGMISSKPASYYTNSKVEIYSQSNQYGYKFTNSGSCNKQIYLQQELKFNCDTDYLVFPENYDEVLLKNIETYGSSEIANGHSTYTNHNKIYYSKEPLTSDKFSFVQASDAMRSTSAREITNQVLFLKYFIVIVGSMIAFSSVLLALCLYGTIKNTVNNLRLIGITKLRVILNYVFMFSLIGLVTQLFGMDLYVYLVYATSVLLIFSVLIWRIHD